MAFGDFPLKDKLVVVTGGGSGICLSFTKAAVAQGAKVLIGDLKLTDDAKTFVKQAKNVKFTECDVTKWKDLENLITVAEKEFGDVPDVYVPGAGIFEPPWSNFWNDSEPERYATLDINVAHPIKLTRLAMRALAGKDKKGVVCCIASIAGLHGYYAAALYCASKHAIVGFIKSLGMAESEGVKVVGICPGIVMTPLWTDRTDNKMSEYKVTDETAITPERIAESMIMLIQEGKYSGGTVFMHDLPAKEVVFPGIGEMDLSNIPPGVREVITNSAQPIRDIMKAERGKA